MSGEAALIEDDWVKRSLGKRLDGVRFVAQGCCGKMRMSVVKVDGGAQAIVVGCPDHGASLITEKGLEPIERPKEQCDCDVCGGPVT